MPYYNRDPKRDHNFDNHPHGKGWRVKWKLGHFGSNGDIGPNCSDRSKVMLVVLHFGVAVCPVYVGFSSFLFTSAVRTIRM